MHRHDDFLQRALLLAERGMDAGGGPFGALVVRQGEIIGEGWNRVTTDNDPTAHAEMVAIRNACRALGQFDLRGALLYTSSEPCPMCLAAIYWARLDGVIYAGSVEDAAVAGFDDVFIGEELCKPVEARTLPMIQGLRSEAQAVFRRWLKKRDRVDY